VGKRLALVALDVAYGEKVTSSGPTYRSHTIHDGRVVVAFNHVGQGLMSRATDSTVGGFAIAGSDRQWVWASARIVGGHVNVWSDRVPHPIAVRYGWANNPDRANLSNHDGLPVAPFRTDTW
jgi:sialate O-acetylesterase